jgi:hypothetical protein
MFFLWNLDFSVLAFAHHLPAESAECLRISAESGAAITMTSKHLVCVTTNSGDVGMKFAQEVAFIILIHL